jgi:hypothetical protein
MNNVPIDVSEGVGDSTDEVSPQGTRQKGGACTKDSRVRLITLTMDVDTQAELCITLRFVQSV